MSPVQKPSLPALSRYTRMKEVFQDRSRRAVWCLWGGEGQAARTRGAVASIR